MSTDAATVPRFKTAIRRGGSAGAVRDPAPCVGALPPAASASTQADGSDREKLAFLQRQVKHDLPGAVRFTMPNRYQLAFPDGTTGTGIQYHNYQRLVMMQQHLDLFEEIFTHFGASDNPLMCITPIVDDKPKIEAVTQV